MREIPRHDTDTSGHGPGDRSSLTVPDGVRDGLQVLQNAACYARDAGTDLWSFAVEIDELRAMGLGNSELRWLLAKRFARQAWEVDSLGDERTFERRRSLRLCDKSCFVITSSGEELLTNLSDVGRPDCSLGEPTLTCGASQPVNGSDSMPVWDSSRRELRYGSTVVKSFRVPAPKQELVLAAFQEEAWPVHIDDPLPPGHEENPKRLLNATITALNRNQKNNLIRFRGDGRGTGICWERNWDVGSAGHATTSPASGD